MTGVRNSAARAVGLRRAGVWMATFALLLQSALPMTGMPLIPGMAGLAGELPSICDVRTPQEDGSAGAGKDDSDGRAPPCPICQVLQQFGTYLPPAATAAAPPSRTVAAAEPSAIPFLPLTRIISSCRVRAPPLSA